jgi:hypothetical protein
MYLPHWPAIDSQGPRVIQPWMPILLIGCDAPSELADLGLFQRLRTLRAADMFGAFGIDLGVDVLVVAFEADVGAVGFAPGMRKFGKLVRHDVVHAVIIR